MFTIKNIEAEESIIKLEGLYYPINVQSCTPGFFAYAGMVLIKLLSLKVPLMTKNIMTI